jgi:hypothetical protein
MNVSYMKPDTQFLKYFHYLNENRFLYIKKTHFSHIIDRNYKNTKQKMWKWEYFVSKFNRWNCGMVENLCVQIWCPCIIINVESSFSFMFPSSCWLSLLKLNELTAFMKRRVFVALYTGSESIFIILWRIDPLLGRDLETEIKYSRCYAVGG